MSEAGLRRIRVPGDKSLSHRSLLFGALARGESHLEGLLPGADCQSTAAALRALGVPVPELPSDGSAIVVPGVGPEGLQRPVEALDCGNSGTTARLLLGVLAGARVGAVLTGDPSLRSRPMRRVTAPLEAMGSRFRELEAPDRLPIEILAEGEFRGGSWILPVASAQVKSALLLAGLLSGRPMAVEEPGRSRDHTERLLRAMGVPVVSRPLPGGGWRVELSMGPHPLEPLDFRVPGDPSSAAFLLALAALGGAGDGLVLEGVGLNPTRTTFLPVLRRMGVEVEVVGGEPELEDGSEPVGDLVVRPSRLRATDIGGAEIPGLIDELPLLAALAVRARGTTRIRDAAELRVKESDRIAAMVRNLTALGVEATAHPDGLDVVGTGAPLQGAVSPFHDHRIAMAFGVLGAGPDARLEVADPEVVEVSFPGFWSLLREVGGQGAAVQGAGRQGAAEEGGSAAPASAVPPPRPPVVTLDGPAGSGKSSTARAVARELGYLHLDSGALYRAVTLALLEEAEKEADTTRGTAGADEAPPLHAEGVTEERLRAFRIRLERTPEGFRVRIGDRLPGEALRAPRVTNRVSQVAALPAVRRWLLEAQRETAAAGGVVADGRDMGTVVFPGAEVKVFLVADLEERARRRLLETEGEAAAGDPERVEAEARRLARRDQEDRERAEAPLRPAADARTLDTTRLDFEEQVAAIVEMVREVAPDPTRRG
jgi:3-phosphoshikimate 1-carboxyvinyltransferase